MERVHKLRSRLDFHFPEPRLIEAAHLRDLPGWRGLGSDLSGGVVSQILTMAHGEFAQPPVDRGVLLGSHFFKQHAHAEDSEAAAGVHVEHFAM